MGWLKASRTSEQMLLIWIIFIVIEGPNGIHLAILGYSKYSKTCGRPFAPFRLLLFTVSAH